jgi:DNA ligase-1
MRALWIPSTRGIPKPDIRFANLDKDGRYRSNQVATGLWSRYANVIHAPDWFLDMLPPFPVDGELWMGRGNFQRLMATCRSLIPGPDWKNIQYRIIDAPCHDEIFRLGKVNNPNYKKDFRLGDKIPGRDFTTSPYFETRYNLLVREFGLIEEGNNFGVHEQIKLPFSPVKAKDLVTQNLLDISKGGGEGVILKAPFAQWEPIRSKLMMKMKKGKDSEGTVVGYVYGDKRLEGMLGSLIVKWENEQGNVVFPKLSGMTDDERKILTKGPAKSETYEQISEIFPLGTQVTFFYREQTDDGLPKEARYIRKKVIE